MEEKYYTVQEVAEKLSVSIETVRRRIRAGELKKIALTQKNYRISDSDLREYIERCKNVTPVSGAAT